MYKFFPHTPSDIEEMLQTIGVKRIEDLFDSIPNDLKLKVRDLAIPSSFSEYDLFSEVKRLGAKNTPLISFMGAGSYDVFDFSVCRALTSRQEFLTSYTPYQPEISQGNLQYIFEFQSMICELTGMDVANASMYDGATAAAEAVFMALSQTRKSKALVSSTLNPRTIEVIRTYAKFRNVTIELIDAADYVTSLSDFKAKMNDEIGVVVVSQPNYYGIVEDNRDLIEHIDHQKVMLIMVADPSTLPVLKTPKAWGADIVCGEAQTLGIPLSFGGPYIGFIACVEKLMRKMPGRICGVTNDVDGKRAYVLTLQAREQHIRREKANSNICSNQSLLALYVVIYMSLLGKVGLKDVALRSYNNAHYLYEGLVGTHRFKLANNHPFFKEFVLAYDGNAHQLHQFWLEQGFLGGLVLDEHHILFCATEKRSQAEIDQFIRLGGEFHV